jgi:hypothetical protein
MEMLKDNFYYCLKERLEYAKEYAQNCKMKLKEIEFKKKVELEYFKKNRFLFLLEELINLPINLLANFNEFKLKVNLKKCLCDIFVMQQELREYERD